MKLGIIAAAALLLVCGCGKRVSDNVRLNNAVSEIKKGEWGNAEKQLEAVLKKNPDNCSARLLQALKYEKDGALDKAVDMASAVASEYPDSFAALYTRGRLLAKIPLQRRKAYETLNDAHLRNPADISTLILLCNLGTELKYKNVLQFINLLKSKPEYAKNNVLNYQLGKCLLLHGKRTEALAAFKSAVSNLSDFTLLFNIARTVDLSNLDREYARNLYRIYLAVGGNSSPGCRNYASQRFRSLTRR